ncbi:ABC-type antimicrobial peptide transport system, permease component [Thermobacillus composti KWC4]|uniref:ABC-type antimicrobial peptide transport system, permease component n=1 Tax=Thermobacillus composti (strain DSM 18247 / JCM 13945 / KWC4) TaxID=717605 RepID=L0EBC1_THECK|nr:ABC transporter permease [Thermobacillus composti]AGA56986.1 ABC-type antimicrobial peptide transport system, permease component [Thermobacillus composti KWC4]
MHFGQGLKMAFKSILGNKLRSVLTMLGVIIGVGSVIALVGIGQGARRQIEEQVQSLGTNLLTVNILGRGVTSTLAYEEAVQFAGIEGVEYAAPYNSNNATLKYGTAGAGVNVVGTNADYFPLRGYELAAGRFITQIDLDFHQKVAVLGSATAEELFGSENPVGAYVRINGVRYKVVGLLAEKGSSALGSNDELAVIPLTTAERMFRSKGVRSVYIQAESMDALDAVQAEVEARLAKIFRNGDDAYRVFNQADMLETAASVSGTLSLALGGIAGISLLVGGIGIMNIMLVSVTERTREIGIRKAIGAKKRDILMQFLIESVTISALGGLLGVGLGLAAGRAVSSLVKIDVVHSVDMIALSMGFSILIGVVFGMYPANKAANLKPIDALRFE